MDDPKLLLAAIIANPAEDTPRLAFADWCDENGEEARARFIRLQYEIEKLPPVGAKASKARKEEEALLKKHGKQWAGEVVNLASYYRFRRGFVEYVRVSAANFLKHGKRLFELAPIRDLHFAEIGNRMPALAASPLLGRAETLGFSIHVGDQLHGDGRLTALLGSPHLATVRRLDLAMSSLDDEDVERVARCRKLGALTHLDLSWNAISDEGLRAVANSDRLQALTSLAVDGNGQVDAEGVRAVVDSPLAERLEHLSLNCQHFGDKPVKVLAGARRLKKLLTLDLSNDDITDAGCGYLAKSLHLAKLERLTLRGHRNTITKKGREMLQKRFGKDVCVF